MLNDDNVFDFMSDDEEEILRIKSDQDKKEILASMFAEDDDEDDLPSLSLPVNLARNEAKELVKDASMTPSGALEDDDDPFTPYDDDDKDDEEGDILDDEDSFEELLMLKKRGDEDEEESEDDYMDPHDYAKNPEIAKQYVEDDELEAALTDFTLEDEDEDEEEEDPWAHLNLDEILAVGIDRNASDVHIVPGKVVRYTIFKRNVPAPEFGIIPEVVTSRFFAQIANNVKMREYGNDLGTDFAYRLKTGRHRGIKTRVNASTINTTQVDMTFRIINSTIPTMDSIGVPVELRRWMKRPNGMIIICGTTGSGKSTTFASLVQNELNTEEKKIISLENPIEYEFEDKVGTIVQRELGNDIKTFDSGIKNALRQNPDIILVGEVRDRSEINEFIKASESGHLSISTTHAKSPESTISRLTNVFEGNERENVLTTLHEQLLGVMNQVLVRRKSGKGVIAVTAVLPVEGNQEIKEMILRGDTLGIRKWMIHNKTTMEHMLADAVINGDCDADDAVKSAFDSTLFYAALREKESQRRQTQATSHLQQTRLPRSRNVQ